MHSCNTINYLVNLAKMAYTYLDSMPISRTPQALDIIMRDLAPALGNIQESAIASFQTLDRPNVNSVRGTRELKIGVGLNTIGMLADRLAILIIREWSIRNKGERDDEKARVLYAEQTLDIIHAMATAQPGSSSLNSKITRIVSDAHADNWQEAFWGLFSTNLILWEAQEILYIKDISILPPEELRAYIKWFAEGNIRRNQYIQLCEQKYWCAV
jgi:hypothetical protein